MAENFREDWARDEYLKEYKRIMDHKREITSMSKEDWRGNYTPRDDNYYRCQDGERIVQHKPSISELKDKINLLEQQLRNFRERAVSDEKQILKLNKAIMDKSQKLHDEEKENVSLYRELREFKKEEEYKNEAEKNDNKTLIVNTLRNLGSNLGTERKKLLNVLKNRINKKETGIFIMNVHYTNLMTSMPGLELRFQYEIEHGSRLIFGESSMKEERYTGIYLYTPE